MILLKNRDILEINGKDAAAFLNNLLTNEIEEMAIETARFCGLLTPQGKYLFDIFIYRVSADKFLLDTNEPQELAQKLGIYKMRSEVQVKLQTDLAVFAALLAQQTIEENHIIFTDPRDNLMGQRVFASVKTPKNSGFDEYETHRFKLGIPDLSQDLIREKDFALEGLMDELHGIDFHKGCYVGQEMTSRMKRRGTLKQKLCRIKIGNKEIAFDTPIIANNTEIGFVRSNNGECGMALVRFDRWHDAAQTGEKLLANGVEVTIEPPEWLII